MLLEGIFLYRCVCLFTQSCLTLWDVMDCRLPGSCGLGDSPGKNTGVGYYALFQGMFPTQGLNPGLPHCRWIFYRLIHQGSPTILEWVAYLFSRGSSESRNLIRVSCIAGKFFVSWATREAHFYIGQSVSSVAQSCRTLCDPNCRTPGFPVHHQLWEFTQTHVHRVSDAIQPSHPLLSPSPPAPNPSQHQGLFQCINYSHGVAKVLEFQLQHQSFQRTPRTDLL